MGSLFACVVYSNNAAALAQNGEYTVESCSVLFVNSVILMC